MGFMDVFSDFASSVGGALDDITGVMNSAAEFKTTIDTLTDKAPNADLASVLGAWAGAGGGFGGGASGQTWQNSGSNDWPRYWTETEVDGTVVHWSQDSPSSPKVIRYTDPPAGQSGVAGDVPALGGIDPILLAAGALALVLVLR